MFPIMARAAVLCVLAVGLASCGVRYGYQGTFYDTVDEALAAGTEDYGNRLEKLSPTDQKVNGNAILILPDSASIKERTIEPSMTQLDLNYGTYVFKINEIFNDYLSKSITKRDIFSSIKTFRSSLETAPIEISKEYDYAIWLRLTYPSKYKWFIRLKDRKNFIAIKQKLPDRRSDDYFEKLTSAIQNQLN